MDSVKVLILIKMEFVVNKLRLGLFLILLFGWIGQSWADYSEGFVAYHSGDYKTALNEFKPLAQQGHSDAQYNLGYMYLYGQSVLQSDKEAVKWYRLAAQQGHSDAQKDLAFMYRYGDRVLQSDKEAVKWYRLAAEQGDADAQNNLAIMYDNGKGVLQNYILGHMWFNLAAYNGRSNATLLLTVIADNMDSTQIYEAQKLAQQCLASNYKNCG